MAGLKNFLKINATEYSLVKANRNKLPEKKKSANKLIKPIKQLDGIR